MNDDTMLNNENNQRTATVSYCVFLFLILLLLFFVSISTFNWNKTIFVNGGLINRWRRNILGLSSFFVYRKEEEEREKKNREKENRMNWLKCGATLLNINKCLHLFPYFIIYISCGKQATNVAAGNKHWIYSKPEREGQRKKQSNNQQPEIKGKTESNRATTKKNPHGKQQKGPFNT